jgi:hypothetical protein
MRRRLSRYARGIEAGWRRKDRKHSMNPKVKAFLLGAAEALAAGVVLGVGSVWVQPGDVILTKAGLVTAATTGAKAGLIYLLGYLRKNIAFREVWTPERRDVERNYAKNDRPRTAEPCRAVRERSTR